VTRPSDEGGVMEPSIAADGTHYEVGPEFQRPNSGVACGLSYNEPPPGHVATTHFREVSCPDCIAFMRDEEVAL
jgi:hypothetical protein